MNVSNWFDGVCHKPTNMAEAPLMGPSCLAELNSSQKESLKSAHKNHENYGIWNHTVDGCEILHHQTDG